MTYCLPPAIANKFIDALKGDKIDPGKLNDMSSADRHKFFADMLGEENAGHVNALYEKTLLLKSQQYGLVTWAKQVGGMTEPARRDLISRIEKMDTILTPENEKEFLSDLVAHKLGATVTMDEAQKISDFSDNTEQLKSAIPVDSPLRSQERMAYGLAMVDYHDYLNHIMGKDKVGGWKDLNPLKPLTALKTVAGISKGIVASLDNSFFGRQGLKMLWISPDRWASAFVKSWGDIGKELVGIDAMKAIKADILSRPNAIDGKYAAAKIDIGVDYEEAMPSHLPEKIPVLGRLYKASESAYNGAALRLRADYADKMIKLAEETGLNMLNGEQAKGVGRLVNSTTGRGHIAGFTPEGQQTANALFFSVKFLKSNLDTLTLHMTDIGVKDAATRSFVRKQAAMNLFKIVGGTAAVLATANFMSPGSTSFDPRSALFGKIKIGKTTIDVTGGLGSIVTVASRLITRMSTSATTGNVTDLVAGKYGQQNGMDVLNSFLDGKFSPLMGLFRDYETGENFNHEKLTPGVALKDLLTPLPVQNALQLLNEPNKGAALAALILDGLGFSANPPNAASNQSGSGAGRPTRQVRAARATR